MTTCRKFQFPHQVCIAYVPHQKKPHHQLPDTIQQRNKAKESPSSAHNLLLGPYKRFYESGTLREEGECKNGMEVYRKEYYDNGKLKSVAERQNGSWNTLERYDSNGKKQ